MYDKDHDIEEVINAQEALDEFEGGNACLDLRLEATPIEQLTFERGEETLRHRVVVGVSDRPHRGSPQQLEHTIELFDTVVLSRLNNRKTGKVIVIAHRIHEDDLSGHLLRQGKWGHVADGRNVRFEIRDRLWLLAPSERRIAPA